MFLQLERPRARGALGFDFDFSAIANAIPGLVTAGAGIYGQVTAAQQQAQAVQGQIQAALAAQAAAQQAQAAAMAAASRPPAAQGMSMGTMIALAAAAVAAAFLLGGRR